VQNVIGIDWDCVEHVSCFLVVWLFSQCWFYQSMSMEGLSILWCLLQFLSSVVYSFHLKVFGFFH
jgi:hypothetical protein